MADRSKSLDEEIARKLQEAMESGELRQARGYGQPLPDIPGWYDTPESLRMPFKILKDAGVIPAEVELFHERARVRAALESCTDPAQAEALRKQLSELEQKISLRLESLRIHSAL